MIQFPRTVLIYVAAVVALGLGITAYCIARYPIGGNLTFWLLFLAFAALAALSDRYGLHFARGTHVHVDTIPLFAGLLIFNPAQALLIASLGRIFGRIGRHGNWPERLFNLGQTLIYVGISALVLNAFTTTPWHPGGTLAWAGLLMAAVSVYLLNTGIVAGIVGLNARIPISRVWLDSMSPALVEHAIMFSFGLLTALLVEIYPWGLLLVALPSIAVFITLDRTLRMEAQQKQLAEQNAELAVHLSEQTEQLREAYAVLEDALDAKNKMLQNVSHELRTPLVAISGYTEALQEGLYGELTEEQLSALETVSRSAQKLIHLVDDLLALQALDRRQLQFTDVDVVQLLENCVDMFTHRAAAAHIDLRGDYAPDLPTLRADQMRLEQVVCNLLDNAIKFSPHGGEVLLKAELLDENAIQISVKDHGIGIPQEELPRIYRRFYQVDSSTTRRFGGQGLGLAISKRIVELHGGTIWAESQVGEGSTFYVTLPLHLNSTPPQNPSLD